MNVPFCECLLENIKTNFRMKLDNWFVFGQSPSEADMVLKQLPDCDICKNLRRVFDSDEERELYKLFYK